MSLDKDSLKAALTMLSVSFVANTGDAKLEAKLSEALKVKLDDLDVEYPADADAEVLFELYTLVTSDDEGVPGELSGQSGPAELLEESDGPFEFIALVGFRQPWDKGIFAKKKDEAFDCDDEELIVHLRGNNLIKRQ